MSALIKNNPLQASNFPGSFRIDTSGYIHGYALPNPAAEEFLTAGKVAIDAKQVIWGGLPITRKPATLGGKLPGKPVGALGQAIDYATSADQITGFTVANKGNSAIQDAGGFNVPQQVPGGTQMFYPISKNFHSGIIIPVTCDKSVVDAASTKSIDQIELAWDFTNYCLTLAGGTSTGGGSNPGTPAQPWSKKGATGKVAALAKGATSGTITIDAGQVPANADLTQPITVANVVISGVSNITKATTTDGQTITFSCDATSAAVSAGTVATFDLSGTTKAQSAPAVKADASAPSTSNALPVTLEDVSLTGTGIVVDSDGVPHYELLPTNGLAIALIRL